MIQLSSRLRRWRNIASFATAAAAALIAMLALQVYQPDLLPDGIRPKPRTQVVEVKTPAPPARLGAICRAAAAGRRLAGLHPDGRRRDQEFHGAQGRRDAPEAGKSFELWLISDKLPQPRSLGVIGASDFTARPVLSSYDAEHDQRRDLCGHGRAGRRLARRQAALDAGLYRQADRDGAGGALSLKLSPGMTGRAAPTQNIENNPMQSRNRPVSAGPGRRCVRSMGRHPHTALAIPQKENARGERAFS